MIPCDSCHSLVKSQNDNEFKTSYIYKIIISFDEKDYLNHNSKKTYLHFFFKFQSQPLKLMENSE